MLDQLQSRLDEQVKAHFPDGGVQRVALLQHGDDPSVEPGDLLVRVFIEEAEEDPPLRAWDRDHETMIGELQRELAEKLPGASHLEFWFGENGRQGQRKLRLGSPPDDPARSEQDLTPADIRLGPADLEMLDALITTGTAASRAEAVSWVLARIRERPGLREAQPSGHENWTSSKPTSDPAERRADAPRIVTIMRDVRQSGNPGSTTLTMTDGRVANCPQNGQIDAIPTLGIHRP